MAKQKTSGANLPVPQSDAEAMTAIAEIGRIDREIARIEADASDEVTKVTEAAGAKAAPLRDRLDAIVDGLKVYCEANRDRLTGGGKSKTIAFSTGTVSWRNAPAGVRFNATVAVIIQRIKDLNLPQFIRTKEEVNKDAMLADPDKATSVAGVKVRSAGESFFVEPISTDVSEVAS